MKHWFLPHEKNNHKANILKPVGFFILYVVYFLNYLALRAIGNFYPGVLGYSSEITMQKVYDATNDYRKKNNLPTLVLNESLSASATLKAKDMFTKGYWAHNSPDGTTPWQFFKDVDYKYSFAGENLAKDFYDTEGLMSAWISSPTHKANIVGEKYQEIGIGVVNGTLNGYKTTLVVQHFGSPIGGKTGDKEIKVASQSDLQLIPTENIAGMASEKSLTINPKTIQKAVATLIFMILVGALCIDAYIVTSKNKMHRLSSSSVAHLLFLVAAFILLLLTQQGTLI